MNSKILALLALATVGVVANEFTDAKARLLQSTVAVAAATCTSTTGCVGSTSCMTFTISTSGAAATNGGSACIPNDFVAAYHMSTYVLTVGTKVYNFTAAGSAVVSTSTSCTSTVACNAAVNGTCCANATSTLLATSGA